jgi:hypothetical protein
MDHDDDQHTTTTHLSCNSYFTHDLVVSQRHILYRMFLLSLSDNGHTGLLLLTCSGKKIAAMIITQVCLLKNN